MLSKKSPPVRYLANPAPVFARDRMQFDQLKRREFITLLGGAAVAWPLEARAQQPQRMRRVGVLHPTAENDPETQVRNKALRQGLAALGWTEGRNILIDYRYAAADATRIKAYAAEMVSAGPDLILATNTPVLAALRHGNPLPIVFVQVTDPIDQGFIASLARPGGNITGFTNFEPAMASKWLEMLKEIAPGVARVALMFNPITAAFARMFWQPVEDAAPSFDVKPIQAHARDEGEIGHTIEALARDGNGGLIVLPDISTLNHRDLIIALAARHRLPTVYPYRYFAANGGLMSYGSDVADVYRRAASYVDRILKGEKPSDLPVQAPVKFELVINLKTAKTLGLDVPLHLQQRADEVIE
jgi:putative ABC transport system substrate-binding protein